MPNDKLHRGLFGQIDSWWRTLGERDRDLYLTGEFPLMFSYNSGRLENEEITLHDTAEIFDHGRVVSFTEKKSSENPFPVSENPSLFAATTQGCDCVEWIRQTG